MLANVLLMAKAGAQVVAHMDHFGPRIEVHRTVSWWVKAHRSGPHGYAPRQGRLPSVSGPRQRDDGTK
jgi:hypothetical protein